jgi:excisionase family DNA binding protein
MADHPHLYSAQEAAQLLAVDQDTISRYIRTGYRLRGGQKERLYGFKVGHCWRIPKDALDDFLARINPGRQVELGQAQAARLKEVRQSAERFRKALEA